VLQAPAALLHSPIFPNSGIIYCCLQKTCQTQINTNKHKISTADERKCKSYISRTACSIFVISFAMECIHLRQSQALIIYLFITLPISANSVQKVIFIHCAINFSIQLTHTSRWTAQALGYYGVWAMRAESKISLKICENMRRNHEEKTMYCITKL
jgi:hypothetical protein